MRAIRIPLTVAGPNIVEVGGGFIMLEELSAGTELDLTWCDELGQDRGTITLQLGRGIRTGVDFASFRLTAAAPASALFLVGPAAADVLEPTSSSSSSGGGLTDAELRASAVPVSGPVTDAQLRASAVPVSGPVTDAQLRASAVPVSGPVTDAQLRASAVPVSGPVTDAQLRASAVKAREDLAAMTWVTAKTAAPAIGAVQADTGALAAGDYDFDIFLMASDTVAVGKGLVVEHRNAANGATLMNLGGCAAQGNQTITLRRYTMALNERMRVIAGTAAGAAASMYVSAIGRRVA